MHRFLLTVLCVLGLALHTLDISAASSPQSFSLGVPPGQWKMVRLQNLPKDVLIALAVKSDGPLTVGFLDAPDQKQFPRIAHPLFWGQLESKLGFSVTIQQQGDYYVVLDNREGAIKRQVSLTTQATLGGAAAQALMNAQLRKVELQLQSLVQKLNQTFVFDSVPIQVKLCDRPQPFERASSLTLCLQYARQLMQTFQDKTQASDALVYSLFQEMSQLSQSQWGLESSEPSTILDELTTVLMLSFRLDANVRAYAQTVINHPTLTASLGDTFNDPLHPLTVERAQRVLKWTADPTLVHRWQTQLVPHMQTRMLQHLTDHPQPWSDQSVTDKELSSRIQSPPVTPPVKKRETRA
ncbi:MAG: hypothetical protein E8D46_13815 [Nitrospira sp.]|nr:MAG: hypothetical protein E8D46_13815 [Nitrospira sp.]